MEELKTIFVRAQQGDLEAYGDIVRRFQDMAVGYAYSVMGDFHLAEDAAQEAFIEAFPGLEKVYEPAAFPAWLRRILFKHCDRQTRRSRGRTGPLCEEAQVSSTDPDPDCLVEDAEIRWLVRGALAELPEAERTVALLFYINEHSQREISAFLDIPVSTVKNRLRTARNLLREEVTKMLKDKLQTQRPSRNETFSTRVQDYLAALKLLHEKLLPHFESTFSEAVGGEVKAEIAGVEHTTFGAYINSGPPPRVVYSFRVRSMNDRAVLMEYTPPLILELIKTIDGGTEIQEGDEKPDPSSILTRGQWNLLHQEGGVIRANLDHLRSMWAPVLGDEVEFHDVQLETHPDYVGEEMGFSRDMEQEWVQVIVDVKGMNCQGTVHLCYPVFTLETVLPGLIQEN